MDFTKLEPTPLERIEKLEQLRVLEHGRTIRCIEIEAAAGLIGVDTEADIVEVESALSKRN
jgi:3-deoxy-manno-octulosonate cytidylyltransferase (CMP-KDO synthetase)